MAVTLKQLGYFVALAEEGHFGRAAERAGISQPALSVQIRDLEDNVSAQLVDRLSRRIRLTRAGESVLARARAILTQVADLEQQARWTEGLAGRLDLGAIPTVAPYLLPGVLTRLRALDLRLELRVREARTNILIDAVLHGTLDAAIVALPAQAPGLVAQALFEDQFVLAGSAWRIAQLQKQMPILRPGDIDIDQLLLLDEGHCLADQALDVCGMTRRSPMDFGAASLATLSGLVSEGMGVTLLPEIAVAAELSQHAGLAIHRFSDPQPSRQIALLHRKGASSDWVAQLSGILKHAGADLTPPRREPPGQSVATPP